MLIGEFARRCRLPVSTLRFYNRIGLLRPAEVDPRTGYRHYGADQVPAAVLVGRLRGLGVVPEDIARVLAGGPDAAAALARQRDRLRAEVADRQRALAEVDLLLAGAPAAGHDPRLVDLMSVEVVALPIAADHRALGEAAVRGIARLRTLLRRHGCGWREPWGGAFPLDLPDGEVHAYVFAHPGTPADPELDRAWLPGGPAVEVVHDGGRHGLAGAYRSAFEWIEGAGLVAAGPVVEEYVRLNSVAGDGMTRVLVPVLTG